MPAQEQKKNDSYNDDDTKALSKMLMNDPAYASFKKIVIIFAVALLLFSSVLGLVGFYFNKTVNDMHAQYIRDTEKIIISKSEIEGTNAWERMPLNERKEKLRAQYYQIVRYYNNRVPEEQKMDEQIIQDSFNTLWECNLRVPSINFFLPVAYMKVASNFNPLYSSDYRYGVAGFLNKTGERIANLKLVREDPVFQLDYSGISTLNSPVQSVKLLVARMDDLMVTFNNRTDWVLLSLFTNEYDVIEKYWDGGKGSIPDSVYSSTELGEAIKYYQSFRNWQIPRVEELED